MLKDIVGNIKIKEYIFRGGSSAIFIFASLLSRLNSYGKEFGFISQGINQKVIEVIPLCKTGRKWMCTICLKVHRPEEEPCVSRINIQVRCQTGYLNC